MSIKKFFFFTSAVAILFDHEKLSFRFQGRDYRLTDVHGHVVEDILT